MNIQIKETGEIKTLAVYGKNNIEWTADLIEAGGLEHTEDGTVIMTQGDFDWWTNYINDHDDTEREAVELIEQLEESGIECPEYYGWPTYVAEKIGENTGNDYEYHRKEAVEAMNEIREEFLK